MIFHNVPHKQSFLAMYAVQGNVYTAYYVYKKERIMCFDLSTECFECSFFIRQSNNSLVIENCMLYIVEIKP